MFTTLLRPVRMSFDYLLSWMISIVLVAWVLLAFSACGQTPKDAAPVPAKPAAARQDTLCLTRSTGGDPAQLSRYASANAELPAAQAGRKRVVLMGNSITDFWTTTDPEFFNKNPYELLGRGISGQVSRQMRQRFCQDVLELHPACVVILAGINDIAGNGGAYDEAATMTNIRAMARMAETSGIKVVLCSVLPADRFFWAPDKRPAPTVVLLNQSIRALAREKGYGYIDYYNLMATPEGGLRPELGADGVHPNLVGYKHMEPLLIQGIEKAIGR